MARGPLYCSLRQGRGNVLQTGETTMQTTQDALSALLSALGFSAMAREVLKEKNQSILCKYARVIVKNTSDARLQREVATKLRMLNLY